jgi:hypothetical protein
MRHRVLIAALALTTVGIGAAVADDDCESPMADWQPRNAIKQMAESKGWTVQRIKIDDGCYEITGRDAKGGDIEVKIHPTTLAIVEMESEGNDQDDDEHDEEDDDGEGGNAGDSNFIAPDPQSTAPSTSPAPRNPLLNGNSQPSGVVQ